MQFAQQRTSSNLQQRTLSKPLTPVTNREVENEDVRNIDSSTVVIHGDTVVETGDPATNDRSNAESHTTAAFRLSHSFMRLKQEIESTEKVYLTGDQDDKEILCQCQPLLVAINKLDVEVKQQLSRIKDKKVSALSKNLATYGGIRNAYEELNHAHKQVQAKSTYGVEI